MGLSVPASKIFDTLRKQISKKPKIFEVNYKKIYGSLIHDGSAHGHRHLGSRVFIAELHSKLSPKIERMEDILTSNVFSF